MSRKANALTVIQQDQELYDSYKEQIKVFTPPKLAEIGLVSTTTLYKYLNGNPINQAKEDAIVRTLSLANTQLAKENSKRLEDAKLALRPQLTLV